MVEYLDGLITDADDPTATRARLRLAALALAEEAQLPRKPGETAPDPDAIAEGQKLIAGELGCTDCHRYHDKGDLGSAPDLTGYGSRQWLAAMIANPQAERFYPDDHNDRMPAFAKDPQDPKQNTLSSKDIELLISWLRGEE